MAIRLETIHAARGGQCEARRCLSAEVLKIVAGDKEMILCEQCFREMVEQSPIANELRQEMAEEHAHEVTELEERISELENDLNTSVDLDDVNELQAEIAQLKERVQTLEQGKVPNETLHKP